MESAGGEVTLKRALGYLVRPMNREILILCVLATLLGVVLGQLGLFDLTKLSKGAVNLTIFAQGLVPPDLSILSLASKALLETAQMAFAGTLLGFFLSLPLGLLAARNLFPLPAVLIARFLSGVVRAVPSLLWALILVVVLGLGPLAGTIALAFYTIGYLAKLYAETFEGVDPEVVEAVRGVGAGRWHLARYVIWPECANTVLSQLLFMLEYNIRASTVLGLVGAGGIGFYLSIYLATLNYHRVATLLLLIIGVVFLMDWFSSWVRGRYLLAEK